MSQFFKKLTITSALVAVGLATATSASAAPVIAAPNQTYSFTGACTDCTGNGIGTLTVSGPYTLGSFLTLSNFVSFVYSSNLIPMFTISSSDVNLVVSGSLPSPLPAAATVTIANNVWRFSSSTSGAWSVGSPLRDFGAVNSWSAPAASAPEPASIGLLGLGLAAITSLARRRAKR